jgi:hypothetical protein
MDSSSILVPLLSFAILVAVVCLIFWVPSEILHKAGFSRWYALLIPFTGFLGLVIFAFIEWPVRRELAWHRLKDGDASADLVAGAEGYAVYLEKRGEWKQAARVYEELASRSGPGESGDYYRNCLERLRERVG